MIRSTDAAGVAGRQPWAFVRLLALAACLAMSACSPAAAPSGPPQRIVALGQTGVYETLLDFGVEDRVVAVSKTNLYPGTEGKTHIPVDGEGVPNVEAIVALTPDLVVVMAPVRPQLEAVGLRVIGLPVADTPESVTAFVRELGVVLDLPKRADEILQRIDADLARVRERTKSLPRRRVYLEHPRPYRTKGRPSMSHAMIELCGGVNVAGQIEIPEPTVNAEFVVQSDPEVIVLGAFTDSPDKAAQRPGWSSITAIREGRVFQINPNDRLLWSSRWVERAERLLLPWVHPEAATGGRPPGDPSPPVGPSGR